MHYQNKRSIRWSIGHIMIITTLVIMGLLLSSANAFAAQSSVTVDELEARLDANGGKLPAYMKTVLKGDTIVNIDLEIIGVTPSPGYMPNKFDSFILFRSDDQRLKDIGGIAMGMSGSPIYLRLGSAPQATDPLVGALSYGDWFTLDNYGLATPIDAMRSIKKYPSTISPSSIELEDPVVGADGVEKTQIIITDTPEEYAADAEEDAIVFSPMKALYMSGINPNSAYGKAYQKHLASKGITIVGMSGATSTRANYSAPFKAGGSVAVQVTSGDFSAGAIGTVTEVDNKDVLAFGHDFMWDGESQVFMSNAWIDGVWPSTITPYKLASAGADRGTIKQDRAAGVYGVDGTLPPFATISAKVTNLDTGDVGVSKTRIPRFIMDSREYEWYALPQNAVFSAACKATDSYIVKGSVTSTTTVKIKDGKDSYTVSLTNLWYRESEYMDVTVLAINDLSYIMDEVARVYSVGKYLPQITDIQFEATYTSAKNFGKVVDVIIPAKGLTQGKNTLKVKIERPGTLADVTIPIVITIPKSYSLSGSVTVAGVGAGWYDYYDYDDFFDYDDDDYTKASKRAVSGVAGRADELTVPEMIDDIKKRDQNNKFIVTFRDSRGKKVEVSSDLLDYVATGVVQKGTTELKIKRSSSSVISYKGTTQIKGTLVALDGKGKLELWKKEGTAGSYEFVKNIPFKLKKGSGYYASVNVPFKTSVKGVTKNTTYQVRYTGSKNDLAVSSNTVIQKVSAGLTLKASAQSQKVGKATKYTAQVAPKGSKGKVIFQYYSGNTWVKFATKTVSASGKASASYKSNAAGTLKVRAQFVPSSKTPNAASKWVTKSVKYK